jgi:hypothetical protein
MTIEDRIRVSELINELYGMLKPVVLGDKFSETVLIRATLLLYDIADKV